MAQPQRLLSRMLRITDGRQGHGATLFLVQHREDLSQLPEEEEVGGVRAGLLEVLFCEQLDVRSELSMRNPLQSYVHSIVLTTSSDHHVENALADNLLGVFHLHRLAHDSRFNE